MFLNRNMQSLIFSYLSDVIQIIGVRQLRTGYQNMPKHLFPEGLRMPKITSNHVNLFGLPKLMGYFAVLKKVCKGFEIHF